MARAIPQFFISQVLFLLVLFGGDKVSASQSVDGNPGKIEVFSTTDIQLDGTPSFFNSKNLSEIELQIYQLDGIQRFEAKLSSNLPTDPNRSKQIAVQRIQQLDEQTMAAVQNAAVGIAKAMQYGVDRYPAIVFDGEAVVYGLTDLRIALNHYQVWWAGARP